MEDLFSIYYNRSLKGKDEHVLFSNFYGDIMNRKNVESWLNRLMLEEHLKNDDVADKLRFHGNALYRNKKFTESLAAYTRALCNAVPDGESYGLVLSNRSAVFFMMNRYAECLSDIDNCIKSKCLDTTKIKVYIRKIKCLHNIESSSKLQDVILEALEFLKGSEFGDNKCALESEILSYRTTPTKTIIDKQVNSERIPPVKDGFNPSFLYASTAIRISYDQHRGRHVRSNKIINPGDVLFIETPYIFAPVFTNTNMNMQHNKCYNCLGTVYNGIPCKYCVKCIFCNDTCLESCWNEFHKWECRGMRSDLWYHIGIAFPALRAILRGISTGLVIASEDYQTDTVKFGNEENNYCYFNRLLTNIDKMKNVLPLVLCASIVVIYLTDYTDFFPWLIQQPSCPKQNSNLINYVGALLLRHIAQLQCNSSVIKHNDLDVEDDSVACAIYPSISMMNHSCKPNITISYVRDVVIVKASEIIDIDKEVFNCYGIDHRYLDKASRQKQCLSLYYFKCECRACISMIVSF